MKQPSSAERELPCQLFVFPLDPRVSKARDVAQKMRAKSNTRQAGFYRYQVTGALLAHLQPLGFRSGAKEPK